MSSSPRRLVIVLSCLVLAVTLSGCGGKDVKVSPALMSKVTTPFKMVTVKGQHYVVGHALEMKVPGSFVAEGEEKLSTDQSSWEWATGPNTAGSLEDVEFSAGVPNKGVQFTTLPQGTKQLAESAPGYKFISEGKVSVPGADKASYLRFERDAQLGSGGTFHVEQVMLFLQVKKGVTSTVRFIAGAGQWDKMMKAVYDSVAVTEGSPT